MNKILSYLFAGLALFIAVNPVQAEIGLSSKLKGRILLQVEDKGKAWYVNPVDSQRYYLGRPTDAFNLMRGLGLGVKHKFITDNKTFPARVSGRILIDVEDKGKAYYINPNDRKAYYLGRPTDAFNLMRRLGLGISNNNLASIRINKNGVEPVIPDNPSNNNKQNDAGNPPDSLINPPSRVSTSMVEQEIFYLINLTRTAINLKPYKYNNNLALAGENHVKDMITNNYFDHNRPGKKFDDFVNEIIGFFGSKALGENIAKGQKTSSEIVQAWLDSPGHKAIILNPDYTDFGVGVEYDKDGKLITSAYFMTPAK